MHIQPDYLEPNICIGFVLHFILVLFFSGVRISKLTNTLL